MFEESQNQITNPKSLLSPKSEKTLYYVRESIVGVCVLLSLLEGISKLFPINKGQAAIYQGLFVLAIIIYHASNFIIELFKVGEISNVYEYLIMSPDVHYFFMLFFFFVYDKCPIFLVAYYGFTFGIRFIKFVFELLAKINQSSVQNTFVQVVTQIMAYPIVINFPTYLEIALTFRVLLLPIFNFKISSFVVMIVYELWIALFNYATNDSHIKVWNSISLAIQEFAAKHPDQYGSNIENLLEKISSFVNSAAKIYPKKDIKVHLQ